MANLSILRSYLCDWDSSIPILGYISANLGSVNISEVGMYLALLGLQLAGLLLCTLHTLVRFASCHRSDCSVLAAGKSRSKILLNIHLEIAAGYELFCHLRCCVRPQTFITAASLASDSRCLLTAPTKNHAHKLLFIFAILYLQCCKDSQYSQT